MSDYFVHESSYVDQPCKIGRATKIWHFCHIMQGCEIGENCNLGQNIVVHGDVKLGDGCKVQGNVLICSGVECERGVFVGPSCTFTNIRNPRSMVVRKHEYSRTLVKEGASIGASVAIVCGHTIGRYAFVGAGSVVTGDVPDFALVYGNPAKLKGYMCKCGERLPESLHCRACQERYMFVGDVLTEWEK